MQGTKIQGSAQTAARQADSAGRGASLDLGPLHLVFLEAAIAADLITASKLFMDPSFPPSLTSFWTLQYRKCSFLANGESLYQPL